MAFDRKVGSFAAPTATGNFPVTGVGFQPKIVLFFWTADTADGSTANSVGGFGVAVSSTERFCISERVNDGTAVEETAVSQRDDLCIDIVTLAAGTLRAATFVSHDADGFTLNFTTVNAAAHIINYIALGGTDLANVKAGTLQSPTATGNEAITGVGFQPDALLTFGISANVTMPNRLNTAPIRWCVGFGKSATSRGYSGHFVSDAADPTDSDSVTKIDKVFSHLAAAAGVHTEADLISLDSDGFTLNWTTVAGGGRYYFYVALKGPQFTILQVQQPAATGSQVITGAGFQPKLVIAVGAGGATYGTVQAGNYHYVGAGVSATERGVCAWQSDDNLATSSASSTLDRAKLIKHASDATTPTFGAVADLTSLDTDGLTLNWTICDGTQRRLLALVVGDAAAAPPAGDVFNTGMRINNFFNGTIRIY